MGKRHRDGATDLSFFEGTEKKVELAVHPGQVSLRSFGHDYWGEVARRAGALVLSRISNGHCDAYLLSESSLFVYDEKMIMITCGRTRLPGAVSFLLERIPPDGVRFFIYERKNEVFPHFQPTHFFDDARALREYLPGRAFRFGEEDAHHLYLYHLDRPYTGEPGDVTVELLMYGLDPAASRVFRPQAGGRTAALRDSTGVDRILPGFEVDDHLFQPHGYSLNAIRGREYWTVHVTPEQVSSYASFETNHRFEESDLESTSNRLLALFRPRAFDLVVFDQRDGEPRLETSYRMKDHFANRLSCGYRVRFQSFFRPRSDVRQPYEIPVG